MNLSIITPSLNNIKEIERTYDSLIHQTTRSFEWIVVDRGSTDGSLERIKQFDKQFTRMISVQDKGVYNAMNKGVDAALGEYLIFLQPGERFYDESVVGAFLEQDVKKDIVSGDMVADDSIYHVRFSPEEQELSYQFMLEKTILLSSSFIRKELFVKYGCFDESLRFVSDWKFFFICLVQHSCSYWKWERCITTYISEDGVSQNREMTFLRDTERERVILELIPSVYRTIRDLKEQISHLKQNQSLSFLDKTSKTLNRMIVKISSIICLSYLGLRRKMMQRNNNEIDGKIIVSLTSWKKRIDNVPLVVESILLNSIKPNLIVLNLSEEEFPEKERELPDAVLDFVGKGILEIIWTSGNLKAFKKFIPTMKKYPTDVIIAIDDDFYYPKDLIETFIEKHNCCPDSPISGNSFMVNGVNGHCGCASLVKASYFGKYIDELFDDNVLALKMDDIYYVFCAALNGSYYQYVGKLFYTNMRPIKGSDGLSEHGRDCSNDAMKRYMVQKIKDRYHIDMTKIHKPCFKL